MTDFEDVTGALYLWAQGVDTRDWPLVASVLLDEFEYDYSSHRPDSKGPTTSAAWIEHASKRFATMRATQHSMSNPRVEFDGDRATCRMYVTAWHVADVDGREEFCTIGGEYQDELVRVDGRWRIALLKLDRRWTVGNPAVLNLPTA
ncbi:nuclear transport factor 2 family protein [Jatrophihabitans fulvus]